MIGDAGLYCRGHAEGLMDPTKVVPHEVKGIGGLQVLALFPLAAWDEVSRSETS